MESPVKLTAGPNQRVFLSGLASDPASAPVLLQDPSGQSVASFTGASTSTTFDQVLTLPAAGTYRLSVVASAAGTARRHTAEESTTPVAAH